MEAAAKGDVRIVKILLDAGANLTDREVGGLSALDIAEARKNGEVIDLLKNAMAVRR
jgi:ankyrin repeat protein